MILFTLITIMSAYIVRREYQAYKEVKQKLDRYED